MRVISSTRLRASATDTASIEMARCARKRTNAVTITNPTDSTVAWAFDDDQRITVDGSLAQPAPNADLVWLPSGGVLQPGQSVDTVATATGLEVGSYDVSCGIDIADQITGETHEAGRVVVSGEVVQARLKFEVPEVDLGLIAVGGRKDYELKFENTAPCGVDVEFRDRIHSPWVEFIRLRGRINSTQVEFIRLHDRMNSTLVEFIRFRDRINST